MKRARFMVLAVAAAMILGCLALSSCGPDAKKVEEVQTKYAELVNKLNNEVKPLIEYLYDVIDQDVLDAYDALADVVNDLGAKSTDGMSNDELDAHIKDIEAGLADAEEAIEILNGISAQYE